MVPDVFDRGYNSKDDVALLGERKYVGALIHSDHKDLMSLAIERDSFTETKRTVYGQEHRIITYHSSSLERKNVATFMKKFRKVYSRVKGIIERGDSDSIEKDTA